MLYKWIGVITGTNGDIYYTAPELAIWNLPIRTNIAEIEFQLFEIGVEINWKKYEFFKPDSVFLTEYDKVVKAQEITQKGRLLCTSNEAVHYDVNEVLNIVHRCENKGYYKPYIAKTGIEYKCYTFNPEKGGEHIG